MKGPVSKGKSATCSPASGSASDLETAALVEGSPTSEKSTAERLGDAKSKIARPKLTDAEQSAEFKRVAREHGAEGDETSFNETLRKLAKRK